MSSLVLLVVDFLASAFLECGKGVHFWCREINNVDCYHTGRITANRGAYMLN
jgi:hypothetical protein